MKTILAVLLLLPAVSPADWSSADTTRQVLFTTVLALDWAQTRYIATHPENHREKNPIIGEHPTTGRVDGYFASSALIHWSVSYLLPDKYLGIKWRSIWQNISIGVETGVVARNYRMGVGFNF
jgi:hypothetical protein